MYVCRVDGVRPQEIIDQVAGPLGRGELILFSGAGLSLGARDHQGEPVPSSKELRREIHELLYPGDDADADDSSLAELYAVALDRERSALKELLDRRLTIDPSTVSAEHRMWLRVPWTRAYTLNIDDFEQAVAVSGDLPRPIESFSALRGTGATPAGDYLPFIHLNGCLEDVPDVTFSEPQYGHRLAGLEPLYQQVVLDLTSAPVVFVGTRLAEPTLWRHIALRDVGLTHHGSYPRSYLISPDLPPARRELLGQYNIVWVRANAEEFARGAWAPLNDQIKAGHARLKANLRRHERHTSVVSAAELLREADDDDATSEYLLGAEPQWSDFRAGRLVRRDFEDQIDVTLRPAALLIHGTAGAGTSSTLMRLAARIAQGGDEALWLNARELGDTPHLIRTLKLRRGNFAVVVDNAEALGLHGRRLLDELRVTGRRILIVLGMRSYYRQRRSVPSPQQFPKGFLTEVRVPHLERRDIEKLIEALDRDGKLGRLTGLSQQQRIDEFEAKANRQLLVAMIEVTSGRDHRKKALEEYEELEDVPRGLYAISAVATMLGLPLTKRELFSSAGRVSGPEIDGLAGLVDAHLLLPRGDRFELRHRVVAEVLVKGLEARGELFAPYLQLTQAIALEYEIDRPHSRLTSLLKALVNYDRLRVYFSAIEIRRFYGRLQDLLGPDYHFWLQRGAYEVKHGNLNLAGNYLERARALGSHDFRVQVEYGYFLLRRARADPLAPQAEADAREGETILDSEIQRIGETNPYPYHVLVTQKAGWLNVAPRTHEQRTEELRKLLVVAEEAVTRHPGYRLLLQARANVHRALLMQAVDQAPSEPRRGRRRRNRSAQTRRSTSTQGKDGG